MQDNWGPWSQRFSKRSHQERGGGGGGRRHGHGNRYFGLRMSVGFKSNRQPRPAPTLSEKMHAFSSLLTFLPHLPLQKGSSPNYFRSIFCCCCFSRALVWGQAMHTLSSDIPLPTEKMVLSCSDTSWGVAYLPSNTYSRHQKGNVTDRFIWKVNSCPGCGVKIQPTVFTEMCLFYSKIKAFFFCFS